LSLRIFCGTALPGGVFVAENSSRTPGGSPAPRKILKLDADPTKSKALTRARPFRLGSPNIALPVSIDFFRFRPTLRASVRRGEKIVAASPAEPRGRLSPPARSANAPYGNDMPPTMRPDNGHGRAQTCRQPAWDFDGSSVFVASVDFHKIHDAKRDFADMGRRVVRRTCIKINPRPVPTIEAVPQNDAAAGCPLVDGEEA